MAKNEGVAVPIATVSTTTDGATLSSTDQIFADFGENLAKIDLPDADAKVTTTLLDYNSKRLARWKKKCVIQRQEETYRIYQSLNDTIGVFAQKDASEIKKKIDASIDANKKNVGVKLTDATKAIKDARTKLETLKKKGEELDTAASSHTMSSDLAAIIKIIGKKEDVLAIFSDMKSSSSTAYSLADDSAEVAIKTSGIYASANVDSLKPLGADIEKVTTDLQTDIAKNAKDAATNLGTIRDEYQKILQQLVEAKYAFFGAKLTYFGVCDTKEQISSPNCPVDADIAQILDGLQKQLEDNFKTATASAQ